MSPSLFVFAMLLLQMHVVCGDAEDPSLPILNNSLFSEDSSLLFNNSLTGDTPSSNSLIQQNTSSLLKISSQKVEGSNLTVSKSEPLLNSENPSLLILNKSLFSEDSPVLFNNSLTEDTFFNSLIQQSTASLLKNSSQNVEGSNPTVSTTEPMLDCTNRSMGTKEFSELFSDLNSSFYVRDGDSVTVCRDLWLEAVDVEFTTLDAVFTGLIVLEIHCPMSIAFLYGRKGITITTLYSLIITSAWFLPTDGRAEELHAMFRIIICTANFTFMSMLFWLVIFTNSLVLKYFISRGHIEIVWQCVNEYNIHILDKIYIIGTGCFMGIALGGLTYLLSIVGIVRVMFGNMAYFTGQPRSKIIFNFFPAVCLMCSICLGLLIMDKRHNRFSRRRGFWYKLRCLREYIRFCFFMSVIEWVCVILITSYERMNSHYQYYLIGTLVAGGAIILFIWLLHSSSEVGYEADGRIPSDQIRFYYKFRITVENKYSFGWVLHKNF